jgi:hypothetical protein
MPCFLGGFAELQKRLLVTSCLPVRPHWTTPCTGRSKVSDKSCTENTQFMLHAFFFFQKSFCLRKIIFKNTTEPDRPWIPEQYCSKGWKKNACIGIWWQYMQLAYLSLLMLRIHINRKRDQYLPGNVMSPYAVNIIEFITSQILVILLYNYHTVYSIEY